MKEKNRIYILLVAVLALIYIVGLWKSNLKLTYLEYTSFNDQTDSYIVLNNNSDELRQQFIMPYDVFDSVSIRIGTFMRDNNSTWSFSLLDADGKVLYEDKFNASIIVDNDYYRHKIKKRIQVKKGELYSIAVRAIDVSDNSQLAYYVSKGESINNTLLHHNGAVVKNTLCFKIYGGDIDFWWHGLMTLFFLYSLAIICRFYLDTKNNTSIHEDTILQGMILGAVTFLLLCSFATNGSFTDENDNMRGGMVIANGGVLYRDYVTQHTPVVYYLCAVFAKLGAGSVEQFRLSYYLFESFIWMLLYIRHNDYYSKKKMAILPLLEVVCISSVITPMGFQVLSDGFQGLLFTALMLEFLRYYNDSHLNWTRCFIISMCIWGSFGAAFVSAYALASLAFLFIILEVSLFRKGLLHTNIILSRYSKLTLSISLPLIFAIIYFKAHHALGIAFNQFYTFNREVYPNYIGGLGEEISRPFINAVQNYFNIITEGFYSIITASATNTTILQFILVTASVCVITKLFLQKMYLIGLSLALMTMLSATRGYGFHGLAAWYLIILTIVLYFECFSSTLQKIGIPVLTILSIILTSTYFVSVGNNLLFKQESITDLESCVVSLTEQDADKDIILDAWTHDSLYLFYKGRKPANPTVYMLPWYMDWYENMNISTLREKTPHVVVYNEDRETWGITHFSYAFDNELKSNYTRLGDEGWKYYVWVRNK